MSKKYFQIAFSILLLAGLALGVAIKDGALAQSDTTTKIEPFLHDQLTAGSADFFVVMTEQADLSAASRLQTKIEKGQYVFDTLVATANRTQVDLRSYLDKNGINYKSYYIVNTILVKGGNLDLANTIANRSDVSAINANHGYQIEQPINPTPSTAQPQFVEPNIAFVKADQVWAMGITGQGTVVAGNDTGLDETHPAIAPHYRGCVDPPTCTVWDHNFNWWDPTGTYPTDPYDGFGHGTHTTGTMVGDDGAGNQIGMAPGAKTIHCKLMDDGGFATDAWINECFQWDLAPWDLNGNNANPALAPDSVNNSWGWPGGGINTNREATDALLAAGIVAEFSAGNEGAGCQSLRSPGDFAEVFTTGSINHAGGVLPGTLTGFSSRGPSELDPGYFPDFMAPGENIRSSLPGGQYAAWGGTSMAGPHVTALIGLLWSANPALRGQIDTTYDIIQQSVVPLTGQNGSNCGGDYVTGPNNDWGYGTIDAVAAVQLAIAMGGSGQLDGTVTDALTGTPIEGANVHALHSEGFAWDDQTDATGFYTMTVAAGIFDVTASDERYESFTISGVEVITDQLTTVDFELTPRGILTGFVRDFDNGFPLVGATVTASNGSSTETLDDGSYEMLFDQGIYTVTASMQDYAPESAVVNIVSGQTTEQDFDLQAAIVFSPSPVHVTLDMGTTDTADATLLNRLETDYAFEFREKDEGFVPKSEKKLPALTPLPVVVNPGSASVVNLTSAFGTEQLNPTSPNVWTAATPYPQTIVRYAKVQCPGENNIFYIIGGVSNGSIIGNNRRFDAVANTWTDLAPLPIFAEGENGVCYEGKIYVTDAGGGTGFHIYDIASNTWSMGASLPRGVECAAIAAWNGQVYVVGGDDNFYPSDGVSNLVNIYDIETNTWVGNGTPMPTGVSNVGFAQLGQYLYVVGGWSQAFPANNDQTQRYDLENDVWELGATFTAAKADYPLAATNQYLYAITGDQNGGGYWDSTNTVWRYDYTAFPNGTWEDTGDNLPFAIQAQYGGFATDAFTGGEVWSVGGLEGSSFSWHADNLYKEAEPPWSPVPPNVAWLGEVPVSGTVPAGATIDIGLFFTATEAVGVNQPGDYLATLKVFGEPSVNVPVIMTVNPPATWGKFDGTVTDKCTNEPVDEAQVDIAGGVPITQTFAGENGYYTAWIEQGTYSVTYSKPGYIGSSAEIQIVAGQTTTNDVQLVPDRPCISVQPDRIEAWVLSDTAVYTTPGLKLTDNGNQPLNFEFLEKDLGYITMTLGAPEPVGTPIIPAGSSSFNQIQPFKARVNAAEIAVLTSTDVSQSIERVLNELALPYDLIYVYGGDIGAVDLSPYAIVILGMDGGAFTVSDMQALREGVIDQGKRLIFMGGTCWQEFVTGVNTYLVLNDIGNYCWTVSTTPNWTLTDASHGLAEGLPDTLNFINSSAGYYQVRVTDDTAEVVGVNGDGSPMYFYKGDYGAGDFIWMIDSAYSSYWADPSDYAFFKQTLTNAINFTGVKPDVTWVWEVPVSGTISGGSFEDIGIYLTSQYTDGTPMPLGTYTATLTIKNDDPIAEKPVIPVIMHIVSAYLAPVPDFSANTPVMVGETMEFINLTTNEGIPPADQYIWNFGDGTSITVSTKDPVFHLYGTFGTFTVTLTACNVAGCVDVSKDVEVLPKVILLPLVNKN